MDKLDNENMREETLDITPPAHDRPLVTGTQGSANTDVHARSWLAQSWDRLSLWLRASAFSPEWLTAPWNHPLVGYLFAILIPGGTIILTLLLMRIFPMFAFPGTINILAIVGVALLWGTGPGLLSTLWGTVLLNFFILSPQFTWSLNTLQHVFETCLFLIIGITISLVASRTEQTRAEAVAAHREAEMSHQHLRDLIMQAPTTILVLRGPEHRFELVNPPGMQILGQRDLVGKTAREAMAEYASQGFFEPLDQVYTTGMTLSVKELCVLTDRHQDGALEECYFNVVYQPTRATNGDVDGVMILSVDVTEQVLSRKRVEELLAQLETEQEVLRDAQQQATERANELESALIALQKSQVHYRRLFNANLIGILLADQEHIFEANDAFLRIIGYDREDLVAGRIRWRELTPPKYLPLDEYAIKELYERGECTPFEKEYIRKDGSHVPILIGAALLEMYPLRWICYVIDITERKRLEQALAERASEVEAIFEAMADGIYVYDSQSHLLRTNTAAQSFNPFTRQPFELSNLPVMRVLQGETLTGSHTTDTILRQPDGTDIFLNVSGAPVRDDKNQIRGAAIVARDVTERRRLEQRTHEALDALLTMALLIGQGPEDTHAAGDETRAQAEHAARDVAQRLAEITRSFLGCQRLSVSIVEPETGVLRPLAVVGLAPEQEHQWWSEQQQWQSQMVDGPDLSLVQRLQAHEVVLLDLTQPPWNSFPNPFGIRTMLVAPMSIRDRLVGLLTLDYGGAEHTYTSEELALTAGVAKLTTLVIERERLQWERAEIYARELALRETKERMDEFLGIVSHELRTPLTTIKGNVQLARLRLKSSLREVPADGDVLRSMLEEMHTMLERAERQVNVQNQLVSDLLDISRLQADKLELRLAPCDLATMVREMVEDQRSATPKRTIHLELAEEETAPVIADAERIGQVLSNYLTNALKYSPIDRPVEVQLEKEEKMVRVLVRDAGPGLTPSEQEQIWERYYQVHGIKRQRGSSVGLGLGLHICRAIVEQHQGEVGVGSTKGEGSTFWFTLPLAEEDHDA
jgi:PAS domain S-box-containing protein